MKFYIAGPYSQKDKLRDWASRLEAYGHKSTASWLNHPQSTADDHALVKGWIRNPAVAEWAYADRKDIDRAQVFILDATGGCSRSGGMMVEFGIALMLQERRQKYRIIVISERINVFCHLYAVECVPTIEQVIELIGGAK